MEPLAEDYEREVKMRQVIIWTPLLISSFLPFLIARIFPLLLIPLLVLITAAVIVPLVLGKSRVKGVALREHDIAYRSGLYWRKTVLLPFNRVQHAEVSSGPLQRKYGLASLKFFTAGGSSVDLKIDGLTKEHAGEVRSYIMEKCGQPQA
jgi:membrane protein YdbS with pleckstrin-like domain